MEELERHLARCCRAHLVTYLGYKRKDVMNLSPTELFKLVYPDMMEHFRDGTAVLYGNGSVAFAFALRLGWVSEDGRLLID